MNRSAGIGSARNLGVPAHRSILLLVCALLLVAPGAEGSALGLPDRTTRLGYGAGVSYMTFQDPVSGTYSSKADFPVNLVMTDWFLGGSRYWLDLSMREARVRSGYDHAGQVVKRYSLGASFQKTLGLFQGWSPWLGGGLFLNKTSYSKRHSSDSDGYLLEKFPSREDLDYGVVLSLAGESRITRNMALSGMLEKDFVINAPSRGLSMKITALVRF